MKEREALKALVHEMEYVLSCINAEEIPFDGDDFHEALRLGKEALAQPEQKRPQNCGTSFCSCIECVMEPEQEPVAWRGYNWGHSPDDWVYRDFDDPILDGNGNNVGQPLYTTPSQRIWVGLTDEEIDLLEALYAPPVHPDFVNDADHCTELMRHVEAKLKEKNT